MAKNKSSASAPAKAAAPATSSAPSKSSGGLASQVATAGTNLSKNEALKIADQANKTVAEVMAKAVASGATLGSQLVNNYNAGKLGPNGNNLIQFGGYSAAPGQSQRVTQALNSLQALQGLQMGKGQVYAGYTTTTTPGYTNNNPRSGYTSTPGTTTYNPIVLPRDRVVRITGQPTAAAPAATDQQTQGPIGQWEESVENSNQALIDSINAQIEANAAQAELYMGQMSDFMASMQGMMNPVNTAPSASITPYAVTTSSVAPASGAQTTSSIAPRKKPTDTDLSISPLVADLSGTGLNIGI
jgi:hypothetical protein